jgi:hypothetical protein
MVTWCSRSVRWGVSRMMEKWRRTFEAVRSIASNELFAVSLQKPTPRSAAGSLLAVGLGRDLPAINMALEDS